MAARVDGLGDDSIREHRLSKKDVVADDLASGDGLSFAIFAANSESLLPAVAKASLARGQGRE